MASETSIRLSQSRTNRRPRIIHPKARATTQRRGKVTCAWSFAHQVGRLLIDGRQVYADYYGFIPWNTLPVDPVATTRVLPAHLKRYNEERHHFELDLKTPVQALKCFQAID